VFEHDPEPEPAVAMQAFTELSDLVGHLGDELAAFRRRALQAEARVRALEAAGGADLFAAQTRLEELERENEELRTRLAAAGERTEQMLERVRFLRQQHGAGGER
jgi:uncharacterized protein YhaN